MRKPSFLALAPLRCLPWLLVAGLASCAGSQRFTASPSDYDDYRRIRLSSGFLTRLESAFDYLERQPQGAWRHQVEPWFERADERYLVRHWDDRSNLERYLTALPNAPRSGLVSARIEQLERLKRKLAERDQAFLSEAQRRSADFSDAKKARSSFVRSLMTWVAQMSTSQSLGKPQVEWQGELTNAFFEGFTASQCNADSCVRRFLQSFEIPRHAGLETRAVDFSIQLDLVEGRLQSITLSGDELFARLAEAATARPVDEDDLQAKAEALGTAAQLLSMALANGFTNPDCEQEAISPVVLARACNGRVARAVAGETADDPDQVIVSQASTVAPRR